MQGKLILIVGPSGSGKNTLISHIRNIDPSIVFPVSCTTRKPRPGEKNGEIYYFLSPEEFSARIDRGDFLEWASYGGNMYGTLKEEILPKIKEGKTVLREIDIQGALQVQKILPKSELSIIFIDAGSWEALRARIETRAPMGEEELQKRHERYVEEMKFIHQADTVVENTDGNLKQAKEDFVAAVYKVSK